MAGRRWLIYSLVLLALPIIVAYAGISTAGAVALVLLVLVLRVAVTLSGLLFPPQVPKLELATISISHFAEKVRWCMDRLGVDYEEHRSAGIIGVLFAGRTVPQLKIRTGRVRSVIGNSPEILRYLWGAYGYPMGERGAFLEPTPERLQLEQRIDAYARELQIWIYHHILDDRALALRAWGRSDPRVPLWQRWLLPVLFPLLRAFLRRAFEISDVRAAEARSRCEELLADVEAGLADGRTSLLGKGGIDYADIAFAAISSAWLQPAGFAAGNAQAVLLKRDELPRAMADEVTRWTQAYPRTVAFVERLYNEERREQAARGDEMDGGQVTVSVARRFAQSADQVFDAWLDVERARRFLFASEGSELIECTIDARVGGEFVATDRRPGGDARHVGRYLEIARPERLVFEFGMPAESPHEDTVTLEFLPQGEGCELTLTSEMAPEYADFVDQARDSWAEILDRLAGSLAAND